MKLYNHVATRLSDLEYEIAIHIPEGGNWKNIPEEIPSLRLAQIRKSGGRTTYYGRMRHDRPSYTITTYFNRLGNGCNLHPFQNRVMSNREAARFQSFPDSYVFVGSKSAQYKQIGNAVPPLLARAIASEIMPHLDSLNYVDLFAGAGGISEGFSMAGYNLIAANEIEKKYFETYIYNHKKQYPDAEFIVGDITRCDIKEKIIAASENYDIGVVVGGPPCQGFSYAGWRDPEDTRNQLFKEFVSVVELLNPEFFVFENVPGILTMRNGDVAKEIIEAFECIGYTVSTPIKLNAEEYGVPQRRKRVVIIGSRDGVRISQPKPLFGYCGEGLPEPITVQEAIGSLPEITAGEDNMVMDTEYPITTPYDMLMNGVVDFDRFYELCLNRRPIPNQI